MITRAKGRDSLLETERRRKHVRDEGGKQKMLGME